jgi:hypothetical protein
VRRGHPRRAGRSARPVGQNFFPLPTTSVQRLPWLYATQSLDGSGPNRRGKNKSAYMKQPFPPEQIATIWRWLTGAFQNSQALLQVDSYGGAINAVASDATAIPQRSSILKLQYQTYWVHEKRHARQPRLDPRASTRTMYGKQGPVPDAIMDGCYVNYPDCDLKDWPLLYYLQSYKRLQQVKRAFDPHDIFNHAQSIRP